MNLSLCCISQTLSDNGHSFKTMTYTQFCKRPFDAAIAELSERILHNFKNTLRTIRFCQLNNIQGYRMSSSLAPVLTHKNVNLRIRDLPNFEAIKRVCGEIKLALLQFPLRISAHPSEYITLSSDNPECIQNSILDLEQHAEIFDLLDLPNDYRSPLNIHVRADGDPAKISAKVLEVYESLPDNVHRRLVLENNDNPNGVWSIKNLVKYFRGIPITFDTLHHSLLSGGLSDQEAFDLAYDTWPVTPIFHYSEGVDGTRKHADMPVSYPKDYRRDVLWETELKSKCKAIFKIRELAAQN
ncbi:MAG: UV DNA damage endonuclease [Ignavibacteriaceae bacterium]|nr:UV DNA damage endonuclease [Ignavibacteriaceae bacterium]